MKTLTKCLLLIMLAGCSHGVAPLRDSSTTQIATAQQPDTYCNPLDVLLADPFIFHEGNTYYLYATGAWDGMLVWTSSDLVNWRLRGHAFKRSPSTWSRDLFWAPELFTHHGKYYLHFTVVGGEKKQRRIVLCESDSPLGPFHELKAPWFDAGLPTIDSHVFRDTDGQLYLYTVYTGTGKDKPAFEIHVRRVDDDLVPETKSTFCITPARNWEGRVVNEGPFVLKHGDNYLLTYSANGYMDPNYSIGLAVSKSPLGPWTKASKPILHRSKKMSGTGHHCFTESPDGKELFIAYHTHQYLARPGGERQLNIDRAHIIDDGPMPTIKVDGPTDTPQPMPSGAAPLVRGQSDEFNETALDRKRWTIFSEDKKRWSLKDGRLTIDTHNGDVHEDRSDLSNLFLEYAPTGDFEITTRCAFQPENDFEQAFLCLWQDHQNYTKIAYIFSHGGTRIEVADEKDGKYSNDLHEIPPAPDIWLKIRRRGDECEYFTSNDGAEWKSIEKRTVPLIDLRAGFGACSPVSGRSIPASFDFFRFFALRN